MHVIFNYNLSWHELENGIADVMQEEIYDNYFNSVQTEQFIDANVIRNILLRNESFNDCFLTEEQLNFFIFLCTF